MSKVIEIPRGKRTFLYRFFEIFPGLLSTMMILMLFILSAISSVAGSIYLLLIVTMNFVKAIGISYRTVGGYKTLKAAERVNWHHRLMELENPKKNYERLSTSRSTDYDYNVHIDNLRMISAAEDGYFPKPSDVYHAVIITMYNESIDVLRPTVQSVLDTTYDKNHMIVMIAYEERGGADAVEVVKQLKKEFGNKFYDFIPVMHPDGIRGEVIGKGANITNAGRALQKYVEEKGIRFSDVIVTTLDSDNRPHPAYFDMVAYEFIVHEERKHLSFQPISLFTNNIWDAPAVTRIVASTNSFWNLICTMRPHTLRNFASHSQPLDALVEMNFWSVRTIVEDGHQYWRSLFYFDGNYEVLPIRLPIYQDAVMSDTLFKTLKAQWVQLRRWDYGASDVAYVASYMFSKKRKIKLVSLFPKFVRLLDGHVTLAAIAPIIMFGGWVPLLFNFDSRDLVSHNLPIVVSRVQLVAALGLLVSIALSMKLLPKRPARYGRARSVAMLLQWIAAPIISVAYSSFCAFYAQYRLLTGRYMEKFDVTQKSVKT